MNTFYTNVLMFGSEVDPNSLPSRRFDWSDRLTSYGINGVSYPKVSFMYKVAYALATMFWWSNGQHIWLSYMGLNPD